MPVPFMKTKKVQKEAKMDQTQSHETMHQVGAMSDVLERTQNLEQNSVATGLQILQRESALNTKDAAEEAPPTWMQKKKQEYAQKKKQRQQKRLEKKEEKRRQEYLKTVDAKIDQINQLFEQQGSKNSASNPFHNEIHKTGKQMWKSLEPEEFEAMQAYTSANEKVVSYISMNDILRKDEYIPGGGDEGQLSASPTREELKKSKENYQKTERCLNVLKKSKLSKDMVFRRGSGVASLARMLGINPDDYQGADIETPIRENLAKFNDGSQIVCDKGFLSTAAFKDAGFAAGFWGRSFDTDAVEFVILGHQGAEAMYLDPKSLCAGECEMLFQAGTPFRIVKICTPESGDKAYMSQNKPAWKVYMETMPGVEPLRGRQQVNK